MVSSNNDLKIEIISRLSIASRCFYDLRNQFESKFIIIKTKITLNKILPRWYIKIGQYSAETGQYFDCSWVSDNDFMTSMDIDGHYLKWLIKKTLNWIFFRWFITFLSRNSILKNLV